MSHKLKLLSCSFDVSNKIPRLKEDSVVKYERKYVRQLLQEADPVLYFSDSLGSYIYSNFTVNLNSSIDTLRSGTGLLHSFGSVLEVSVCASSSRAVSHRKIFDCGFF